jgi:hypothetical protein
MASLVALRGGRSGGGLTWGEPRLVFQSGEVHLCEPGLVRSPDGRRLAALLRENRRVKDSHVIFSDEKARPLDGR